MNREIRTLDSDQPMAVTTREDGTSVVSGYAAIYYRKSNAGTEYELFDRVVERIHPGAFDEALERNDDVRALFNHNPDHVLGRTQAGTLKLSTNTRGLKYEVDVPDTQSGRDLAVSIRRGDITGSSFAFVVEDERWTKEKDLEIREIHSVRLLDVSPVTYPAYAATTVGMRAEDTTEAKRMYQEWKSAKKLAEEKASEDEKKEREQSYQFTQARWRVRNIAE